jgi:hypothetical protein
MFWRDRCSRLAAEQAVDLVDGQLHDEPAALLATLDHGLHEEGRRLVRRGVVLVVDERLARPLLQAVDQRRAALAAGEQVLVVVGLLPDGREDEARRVDEQDVVEGVEVLEVVPPNGGLQLFDGGHRLCGRALAPQQAVVIALDQEIPAHGLIGRDAFGQGPDAAEIVHQVLAAGVPHRIQLGVHGLVDGGLGRRWRWRGAFGEGDGGRHGEPSQDPAGHVPSPS